MLAKIVSRHPMSRIDELLPVRLRAFGRQRGGLTTSLTVNQNNDGKVTASGIGPITGGTGKLADMHGVIDFVVNFDVMSSFNEGQTDIDHTIGK